MSEEIIIYESAVFTSSAVGGTGFSKSNKKQENISFTPSPKKDFLCNEFQTDFRQDNDQIDTQATTPVEGMFSRSYKEKNLKKIISNNQEDLILNFYNNSDEKEENDNMGHDKNNYKVQIKKNSIPNCGNIGKNKQSINKFSFILKFFFKFFIFRNYFISLIMIELNIKHEIFLLFLKI